ncbi:MAG: FAD/NAD(P)-binding oxidoreductase [Vicingaceae bacterium]
MKVVIIGNGIAGITAARTIRKKSDCDIVVVSSETKYFFSRTALMYVYMGHMKFEHTQPYEAHFWNKNNIELVRDHVEEILFDKSELRLRSGGQLTYDKLLLATGSKFNKFGWPGQDLPGVQGMYSAQDLELLEKNTHPMNAPLSERRVKKALIVGGGLIGIELAEMLRSREIEVCMLIRESRYWGNVLPKEESKLILRHLEQHQIDVRLQSELKEIRPGKDGRVESVLLLDGNEIQCQLVGLTAGVSPNIDFVINSALDTNRGILVNRKLETNLPGVYAAGDCVEFSDPITGRNSIEQVWYTGRMMGEIAGQNILGLNKEYAPGPWFNSAKFFDIEYQTYGRVGSELGEGEQKFYWEDQNGQKAVKVIFDGESSIFVGINSFGIRLRHQVFDRWLKQERSVDFVLENFRLALFDPEFYKDHTRMIIEEYNKEFNKNISPKAFSWKKMFA